MKKVFDITKLLSGQRNVQSKPVKDKSGGDLTRTEGKLNRWKEHLQEDLNRPAPENPQDLEGPSLVFQTGHSTIVEVSKSLKALKNGKLVRCNNILPEF